MCNIHCVSIEQLHRVLASRGENILWSTIWQNKALPYYGAGCEGVHRVVDRAGRKESEEALCVLIFMFTFQRFAANLTERISCYARALKFTFL